MMFDPFRNEHADPWASDIVDYEPLNAGASEAIVESIEAARSTAPNGPSDLVSRSLLILGPAGSGKTHLFVRVRRRSGPRAAFVLLRPLIAAEPSPRMVLASTLDALSRPSAGTDDRQLDVVVASLLATVGETDSEWPHVLLESYRSESPTFRRSRFEAVLTHLEGLYPEVSIGYLEQLLRAPFLEPVERRAVLTWLSGRDLSSEQLARLGMAGAIGDVDVMPALRTLGIVAAFGAPIVLVFDQLENLVDMTGEDRVIAHGNLVSELIDATRGLTVVQMALDAEWARRIRPALSASQRSRVESRVIELNMPTRDERRELVRAWIERLPPADRAGDFPAPFSAAELDGWLVRPVMTPRMLLLECRSALERIRALTALPSLVPPAPQEERAQAKEDETAERLEQLWSAHLRQARHELADLVGQKRPLDAARLGSGLLHLIRLGTDPSAALQRSRRGEWIQYRVGDGGVGPVRQLRIVQQPNHRSVGAAIEQAAEATGDQEVLVVRERRWEFPPSWHKTNAELAEFVALPHARFEWLDHEEVVRLLAIDDFLSAATSQDLDGLDGVPIPRAAVDQFVRAGLGWQEWTTTLMLGAPFSAPVQQSAVTPPKAKEPPKREPAPAAVGRPQVKPPFSGVAIEALRRLKVASTDRVFVEARRADPKATRAAIIQELRAAGDTVRWFGPALVSLAEVGP